MKYYKNKNSEIYAYDDDIDSELLATLVAENGLTKITEKQMQTLAAPTLEQVKESKLSEIKSTFESELDNLTGGLAVDGVGVVDCGKQHLLNVQGLITVLEAKVVSEISFRLYDNSYITLNLSQLKSIELALLLKAQELYSIKWELEKTIEDSNNIEDIKVIEWK